MKVGFVIYGSLDTVSGGYLYDRKLVEYLRAQGDTVEIISLPWRNYAAHLTDNFWFRLPKNLDILIEDELNHPSLIAANAENHSYPIISLVHHLRCSEPRPAWQNLFYRLVEKKYLQGVDGFIFNSKTTRAVVQELVGDEKPFSVGYPAGNRLGTITEEEIIARTVQSTPLRILFVGAVIPRKGLHILLDAIARLPPSTVTLDVAGGLTHDIKYTNFIRRQIHNRNLSSVVKLHGNFTDHTFVTLLRSSHILALPSSYEGFGIAYLEAMAFGLPVIGTTAGAAKEIINDGETGFIIQPDNSMLLAKRIEFLANSKQKLLQMSLVARKQFLTHPTWIGSFDKVRQFLSSVFRKS